MKFFAPVILFLLAVVVCDADPSAGHADDWAYLDNGVVRIGVDKSRGGCIGYFAESASRRNLLNHYDEGRFLQQSFYGDPDGSDWNGKPWRYNPVQGGNWQGKRAKVIAWKQSAKRMASTTEPVNWAGGESISEMAMMQEIRLNGAVAEIEFSMTYAGPSHKQMRHQEMPALFVDAALENLVFRSKGKLTSKKPGQSNERGSTEEHWVAYLDDASRGIGLYVPGTPEFTAYRHRGDGKMGPTGSACSYVAPIRTFRLKKGMKLTYRAYLTIGSLKQIQTRFNSLRAQAKK